MTTKDKGNSTELHCLAYLNDLGYPVAVPYGECARYDIVLDVNGKLFKIQVKTCREVDGCIEFSTRSTGKKSGGCYSTPYTESQVDYFATFYKGICYLVPFSECSSGNKMLRVEPPKKKDAKVHFLEEYEAQKILLKNS